MILKQWHSFCLCAEDNTLFPQRRTAARVFNHHSFFSFSTMEIFLLMLQIGNLRINRDNSFRKLEHISQCIDKTIVTNQHVPASSRFKPTIAITTKQNSRPRSMVKQVTLYYRFQRSAE